MIRRPSAGDGPANRGLDATHVYVGAVCLGALALIGVGYAVAGPPYDWAALVVLIALAFAGWMLRETDTGNRVLLSITSIVLLASAVIVGPVGAGVVGALANLAELRRSRSTVWLFNAAMHSAIGSVGSLVYLLVGGSSVLDRSSSPLDILAGVGLPLLVADIAQCLVNAALLAGVMRASRGIPVLTQVVQLFSTTGVAYIGYGIIGFLFVVLWIPAGVGPFSAVLVLAPLLVARWAFVQYGDEVRSQQRTLRALVTAVEVKDPGCTGHSERTADLSEWIAQALGLGHKEIQDVRTAGMLHDIGKVSVPARLLRSRRPLTDDELVVVAEHALSGVELVQGIDFLADSVDGIAHHHERFDGLGYPAGLSGSEIPLVARVVAVADMFDNLTTQREYRPALTVDEALRVVVQRSGTHFDPDVVQALTRALSRHEWPLQGEATSGEWLSLHDSATTVLDHDEPEVSDLLAQRPELRELLRGATANVRRPRTESRS